MNEIFKEIPGCKGQYQISNFGRVKSLARKGCLKDRILKPWLTACGYPTVSLHNGKQKTHKIHQLVAMAFLGHKLNINKLVVDHIDFDRTNNYLSNLRIITHRENTNQKHMKSSSQYTGVCWHKQHNKWMSSIKINGKKKYLGYFTNELDASKAYEKELKKINQHAYPCM